LERGRIVRSAGGDHHVVDRCSETVKERLQGGWIVGIEGCGALRVDLERRLLEALGIAPGENHAGALGAGSPCCFEPDARAPADDDDGLTEQFRFARHGRGERHWRDPVPDQPIGADPALLWPTARFSFRNERLIPSYDWLAARFTALKGRLD